MEKLKIQAEMRDVGKKGFNRRLRREGMIPAILYGRGESPRGLSVNAKEFTSLMKGAGVNALIDLELAGEGKKGPVVVMLKDFQTDTLTRRLTHVDLFKISMREKVTVKIPIRLVGKSVGVTKGGLIEQSRRELEAACLPDRIPERIEIDITPLDIGQSFHLRDVKLPEGVETSHEVDFTVVSIVAPREEEAAPAAPAAGEVPVVGEAKTGEAAPTTDAKEAPKETKGERK